MTPSTEEVKQKPRLAVAIATALGVGYAPKAPGTFGSLVGVATAMLTSFFFLRPHGVADLFSRQRLMERTLIDHHFLVPGADIHDAPLIVPVSCNSSGAVSGIRRSMERGKDRAVCGNQRSAICSD